MKTRCIIIEDQRPAQKILERYIEDTAQLELVGTFFNALAALELLKTNQVDLIFLDIHLPKLSGIDFLKVLPKAPQIIFTTAFPDYALTGYELNAVDYLLKPFDFGRFCQAISKVQQTQPGGTQHGLTASDAKPNYYFARLDRDFIKIRFDDILFIQASGDFVEVYFLARKLLLSENLKHWEERLPTKSFVKVHKSYLVCLDQIEKVSGNMIYLKDHQIPIGRAYRKDFLERLTQAGQ